MKGSLKIIAFFIAGIVLASAGGLPDFLLNKKLSSYALYLLMFLVGIVTGMNPKTWEILKRMQISVFAIPISAMIGTWGGVALLSLFVPYSCSESLAVGSGFGYYSLSSIIISELHSKELGVIALLSNIFREMFTLLFTPVLAKCFGKITPIAVGGATSMDTTLPIIIKYVGTEYALISVFNGTILTIIVPFIVSLFLNIHC